MGTDSQVSQMRKGALEYCVMSLLTGEPGYGFDLVQRLGQVDGLLTSEGTIYPLLARLRRDGLVETEWRESQSGPPRRYYAVTAKGAQSLDAFRQEWSTFKSAVDSLIGQGGRR